MLHDHPTHSPRATAPLEAIERGERAVRLAETVVFEAAFTLEMTCGVARAEIRAALELLLALPGSVLPGKRVFPSVFARYVSEAGLSFADCCHAVLTIRLGLGTIVSFDRKLDRVPGLTRTEP